MSELIINFLDDPHDLFLSSYSHKLKNTNTIREINFINHIRHNFTNSNDVYGECTQEEHDIIRINIDNKIREDFKNKYGTSIQGFLSKYYYFHKLLTDPKMNKREREIRQQFYELNTELKTYYPQNILKIDRTPEHQSKVDLMVALQEELNLKFPNAKKFKIK